MHRKKREHRGLKRVGVVVAIIAIPAIAIAAIVYVLGIQASLTTGNPAVAYVVADGVTIDAGNCTGSLISAQALSIGWTDPWPGDDCDLTVSVEESGNTVAMKLQGVVLDGTYLTGTLGADCGTEITVGDITTPSVSMNIAIDAATPFDELITFFGNGEGLQWVPSSDYNAGACA